MDETRDLVEVKRVTDAQVCRVICPTSFRARKEGLVLRQNILAIALCDCGIAIDCDCLVR